MLHPKRMAKSVEEFTAVASELRDKWMNRSNMAILPWFRGQSNADWDLKPKFYRASPSDTKTEWEIREEFITHAPALCDVRPTNEWEWYFLMQHYGAPTRLLDWTDGALIALYFAVRDNRGDRDAAVWALDPWWLNLKVIRKDEVIPAGDPLFVDSNRKEKNWLPKRLGRSTPLPKLPIAVLPGHIDRRIGAQRSSFTIHGTDADGLLTVAKGDSDPNLVEIVIPSWEVRQIRRSLDTCGIDETTVFPNLEALSRVVEFRWKEETQRRPHARVHTRLRPSKIHGVGVFAIRRIRKGTRLFFDDLDEMVWVRQDELGRLPREIKKLYDDFSPLKDGRLGCPRNFNRLTMAWYLNESKEPNVRSGEGYNFIATRDIKPGEELTVDYSSYSDPPA